SKEYSVDLGTLSLVGGGIASAINDTLHLSFKVTDVNGSSSETEYTFWVNGSAFYDPVHLRAVGRVAVQLLSPPTQILDLSADRYLLTLDVPTEPFLLTIPNGSSDASYALKGLLSLVEVPEPSTA